MSTPDFSEPSPKDGYYDVFLSFRGKDTRSGFATNLYHALRRNEIHTFMDVDLLGEEIEQLFGVIAQSRMAVVIYSKNYASSHWCLQELEKILQLKREKKMLVTPIFYKVNIDEMKHLSGQTAEYLNKHVAEHGESTVQIWKDAVTNFARVSGLSYTDNDNRSEHEFIENVISKIKKKLRECQQHSVDQSKESVYSQSSSSHQGRQQEGMLTDKQCFTYGEILIITNNLDKVIARGYLGNIYSGKLNGAAVSVKIITPFLVQKAVMEQASGVVEGVLRTVCSFRHENLVSLLGYCFDYDQKLALVYEFMPNGDLRKHLSGTSARVLTWKERVKTAIDIAEGLKYLHGMDVTCGGNLQSSDIVFDENMTAKIFFVPFLRDQATHPYDRYITSMNVDAASLLTNNPSLKIQFNKKVDLHCFARIMYELITRYEPPLTNWQSFVNILCRGNLKVDSRFGGVLINMPTVGSVTYLAYYCAQLHEILQPLIGDVLEALKTHFSIITATEWMNGSLI